MVPLTFRETSAWPPTLHHLMQPFGGPLRTNARQQHATTSADGLSHCISLEGACMQVNINGIETRYVLSNEGGGPWLTFIH